MRRWLILGVTFLSIVVGGSLGIFWARLTTQSTSALSAKINPLNLFDNKKAVPAAGAIINHHLLVANLIGQTLAPLASQKIQQIILISPNHFDRGNSDIIVQKTAGTNLPENLIASGVAHIEARPFIKEHGVYNVTPYLKKYFPAATIVPIIIKDRATDKNIAELVAALNKIAPNALIIGSFDFSHYLPANAAELHDATAISALKNFDFNAIKRLDIDSRPGLRAFAQLMQTRGALNFNLIANTNSARLAENLATAENTSYVDGYFTNEVAQPDSRVTLLALGDLMLDRNVRRHTAQYGLDRIFTNVERLFSGTDLTIVNSEGSFTNLPPDKNPHTFSFTFDPRHLTTLKKLGFNFFSLANNHADNFGATGMNQTKKNIRAAELNYFGDPRNATELSTIANVRGLKIALVGFHELSNVNFDKVISEIKKLRPQVDKIIVYPHWGTEYELKFTAKQQNLAHQFIDAGADVVIGSHPHVVEPLEIYKNRAIFYSLGNFVFDQMFSAETQEELAVGIVFNGAETQFTLLPLKSRDVQLLWPDAAERAKLLNRIAANATAAPEIKTAITTGQFILK